MSSAKPAWRKGLGGADDAGAFGLGDGRHLGDGTAGVGVAGMGEDAGELVAQGGGDGAGFVGRDAAAAFADVDLDQGAEAAWVSGDGSRGFHVVGDDLDVGARRVEGGHGCELLRGDADGVDLVVPAGLGEETGLGEGADGDGACGPGRRGPPPRAISRS
jgi:hypothetical protein